MPNFFKRCKHHYFANIFLQKGELTRLCYNLAVCYKITWFISFFSVDDFCRLTFRGLRSNKITNPLVNVFCKMYYSIRKRSFRVTLQKNDTFRIFCEKLYILLSVDGSTNRRNEIIFGDIIIIKYGNCLHFLHA